MAWWVHWTYPFSRFSRAGGSGLLTTSRLNDFELYRPPAGTGLDPLTTTQRAFSIRMTPAQAAGVETSAWTVSELVKRCGE